MHEKVEVHRESGDGGPVGSTLALQRFAKSAVMIIGLKYGMGRCRLLKSIPWTDNHASTTAGTSRKVGYHHVAIGNFALPQLVAKQQLQAASVALTTLQLD